MIAIIDYDMGNLRSVSKAVEKLGGATCVTSDPEKVLSADKVILPGVGAFGHAMAELKERKLIEPILKIANEGKPLLGICLGLQLLFESSDESPKTPGLNLLKGHISKFKPGDAKIPHMGWNDVEIKEHPLLKSISNKSFFYFVHTYYAIPQSEDITVGHCQYAGENFAAIVSKKNIFATQFHPEKSQEAGLQILKNFVEF